MTDPDSRRPVRLGRYATEADLAAAAENARRAAGLTQTALAARLGVSQSGVAQALAYAKNPTSGHSVRRRILAELRGLSVAGPYFLPIRPGETAPGQTGNANVAPSADDA